MNFVDAVKTCFQKYADFNGRAARPEFWWWALFYFVAYAIVAVISIKLAGVFGLLVFLPSLAVSVRRLHDTGRSGWWVLIGFVPIIGWIVLLIFYLEGSKA